VTVRLTATIARAPKKWTAPQMAATSTAQRVTVRHSGKNVSAALVARGARKTLSGPAIISEYSATAFVPPNWKAAEDRQGNLVLRKK
jgi:N-methylhydantoinase A/oxoprolinase/acetone carboxylase beta subunit